MSERVLDRRQRLMEQNAVTGIDFIYVHEDEVALDVYFFHSLLSASLLASGEELDLSLDDLRQDQIIITSRGEEPTEPFPLKAIRWELRDGRHVLRIKTLFPGGFSLYTLTIDDPRIDPYYNQIPFSFKAHCNSGLDCAPRGPWCPPEEVVDFPVDYRARDFWSLRRALLDFAAERYPDWQDRLAADAGVMLVEVMSALGDELAYYQDRIGREAYLETATQRRSLRRHARLVDYEIHDGLAASTWLEVTVASGSESLPAGTDVWAEADDGARIYYEIGRGLEEVVAAKAYSVKEARNNLVPHIWHEEEVCLDVGTTAVDLQGAHRATLGWADSSDTDPVRWVLLKTQPTTPLMPARRWLVELIQVEELEDPLEEMPVTRLLWEEKQALPFQLDLRTLRVRANLVPVTAGRTFKYRFVLGAEPEALVFSNAVSEEEAWKARQTLTRAVEREGPALLKEKANVFSAEAQAGEAPALEARPITYLFSEPDSLAKILDKHGEPVQAPVPEMLPRVTPLTWLGEAPRGARPEVRLAEIEWQGGAWKEKQGGQWEWRSSLLGSASQRNEAHFTLEDSTWRRVVGFHRQGRELVHRDYASGAGKTIRFGDGEFGMQPPRHSVFELTCRLGNGRRTNVAADSLQYIAQDGLQVTNPLPAAGGVDPETADTVRQMAPDAFRAVAYRAVRPRDYAEAAERLDWVNRAGAAFRWTGSWITAVVIPDPRGTTTLSDKRRGELTDHLNRFRQAGREAYVAEPRYADIDLKITVCVAPDAYRGEVKERVLEALLGRPDRRGFFSPDNFTFGTPLYRSRLEAAIQRVSGVWAVEEMLLRRRGVFDWRPLTGFHIPVDANEIIRLENDPDHPDRGTLTLNMEGGA